MAELPEPSVQARALARFLLTGVRPLADRLVLGGTRLRAVRELYDSVGFTPLPRGTRIRAVSQSHGYGEVTGLWITAREADERAGALLYLHGGGFVLGSLRTHRHLAAALSQATGLPVLLLDYRRAPEHPYPAAADDTLAAYHWLLDQGHAPGRVVVAGDSAGGHLVAGLLAELTKARAPMPGAAVLFSPFLDLTCADLDARDSARRDPYIPPARAREVAALYAGALGVDHPRLAVLRGSKRRWPPTLVQVGDTECLLGDAERLAAAMVAAGAHCELEVWPGQVHAFPVFFPIVPEGRLAIQRVGVFVREATATELAA
ncbi:alpha/beta hydrolase [Actinokineospora auranticolor]|nr:alpha/beta hydrolase [Actinokineospora auranticolor]